MYELTITLQAPELSAAVAALAAAMNGTKLAPNLTQSVAPSAPLPSATAPAVPIAPNPPAPAASSFPASAVPVTPTQSTYAPPPAVPTAAAPTYNLDQIMTAGAALIDTGKINELMGLLHTFGVQAVTQLKQEQLGAFATELRKLGAQI